MKNIILLASILGLAACGDNLSGLRPDAREHEDGAPQPDSPPGTPDADTTPDADSGPSTVDVATGACPGTPDHTLTNNGMIGWTFDGTDMASPAVLTIAAGETIEWHSGAAHNFASVLQTGSMSWRSGDPVAGTSCLTFNAAGGPALFHCENHPTTMSGTLTVTP